MSENRGDRKGGLSVRARSVDALATKALSVMAEKRTSGAGAHRAAHLRDLFDSAIEPDGENLGSLIPEILRLGVPSETVTDIYIPEVARRLGAAWLADRLSFVEVTIGTARLQAVARDLAAAPDPCQRTVARVFVVVPRNEDHTLGAVILSGQLRRMGVTVSMHAGESSCDVAHILERDEPDAVMISASHVECVDEVAALVSVSRRASNRGIPVAVGGPILDLGVDILHETRADHVVSDAAQALSLCGLTAAPARADLRERA